MVILYEIHSFRIIDVPGCNDMLPTSQSESASAEHWIDWKLFVVSSEFHLTLKRVHRAHFYQLEIPKQKRDILSEKRESGMALTKREFTPGRGTVDTYGIRLLWKLSATKIDENIVVNKTMRRGVRRRVVTPRAQGCHPTCPGLSPHVPRVVTPRAQGCHPTCPGLSPHVPRVVTPRAQGCHPTCPGLSPHVPRAVTPRAQGCHPTCPGLSPHVPRVVTPRAQSMTLTASMNIQMPLQKHNIRLKL